MILVGELSLWVALLMAAWAAAVSFVGGVQNRSDLIASGERAIYAALAMVTLASLGLGTALIAHDFTFQHVAWLTSANLPVVYNLSAFWSGRAGSLLFFALILAGCAAAAAYTTRDRDRALPPYVNGTLATVLAFSLAALCFAANPYERLDWVPLDGRGMEPVLRHPGIALHPPALYLGLAATAVPFAFAIAALVSRQLDDWSFVAVRRWVLLSWIFLTIGILLGMWWAYGGPDTGRHWALDSIASASLFPWLINTALLHSSVIQDTRGRLWKWNVILVVSAFLASIYCAFLARGGIISTVNSFTQSPIREWFAGFFIVASLACAYLLTTRLRDPRSDAGAGSLAGTDAPGRASVASRARTFAAHVVHSGVVVMLVGLAGLAFVREHAVTLSPGASRELRDPFGQVWTFTSQGVSRYDDRGSRVVAAALDVTRDGRSVGIVTSEQRQYMDSHGHPTFEPYTDAGTMGSLKQDVRLAVSEIGDDERVEARISFNPLVVWVWLGGIIMAVGGLIPLLAATDRRDA